eukprot:CAMPEP_0197929472 /NCGR_PEP_ID=MMETSP1439-20131203/103868_1 /TAXON_ID=66791 /ORGANISM="Gonyaulax spinifera, Strain CCMP409" /LENGTH=62 /DNA_ID=CAMNT_0043552119 /DNA_START=18 /DNA_END=203 /DNA_ORIENTATION=-
MWMEGEPSILDPEGRWEDVVLIVGSRAGYIQRLMRITVRIITVAANCAILLLELLCLYRALR